ncbi:hypothetical protein EJ04DRAFT_258814 [Polyplosphaeria fusca]|uniref:Uncharacterized protein n=1 Tax=Polyplosphaeria fusca TaxID=682080 RepID=A0A9P4V4R1_9PLEO|nr:hypothetical protein EJ04DRAFT_258814 [Polyplosphaeria fusca]
MQGMEASLPRSCRRPSSRQLDNCSTQYCLLCTLELEAQCVGLRIHFRPSCAAPPSPAIRTSSHVLAPLSRFPSSTVHGPTVDMADLLAPMRAHRSSCRRSLQSTTPQASLKHICGVIAAEAFNHTIVPSRHRGDDEIGGLEAPEAAMHADSAIAGMASFDSTPRLHARRMECIRHVQNLESSATAHNQDAAVRH